MNQLSVALRRMPTDRPDRLIPGEYLPLVKRFFSELAASDKQFFLADEIDGRLGEFLADTGGDHHFSVALRRLFRGCQEILVEGDYTYAVLRPKIGVRQIVRLHPAQDHLEHVSRREYLEAKDTYVQGPELAQKRGLVLDFEPYFHSFPKVKEPREMGEGLSFLNRHLSGQMYQNPERFRKALVEFLRNCHIDGTSILINDFIESAEVLSDEIDFVRTVLADRDDTLPYVDIAHELRTHGFEAGWGPTLGDVRERLALLARVLDTADATRFESFLSTLPLVKRVLMVSPHGWFGQEHVLGRPDTGGQVTYVLDEVRALEREMIQHFRECGLDTVRPRVIILTRLIPNADETACNLPREKVHGSVDSWIIRVPFRDPSGQILNDWISRFQIWPYLEDFAEESKSVVVSELMGKPDLIIGHYSDGNLVAHRLADDLDVTHCAAVHALEKTKYLQSDMYWADMENDYRFSLQFTADLIAYNSADYIISSTYREIGGSPTELGMFESYETFSMPGLYRVASGFDARLARHNIVPPGASEDYFFAHTETDRRPEALTEKLNERFFGAEPVGNSFGKLENPDLPPVFAMARLDRIKNLSGLAEIFGQSERLKGVANLFIVSSVIDTSQSTDHEEIDEVHKMYDLIERYHLNGHFRWCASRLDKSETGEIYRVVADRKGVFAQPAFMETFGLTVIEAMACGLPVVVTCFGGPSEIVVSGHSGLVRNPNDHAAFADGLADVVTDSSLWQRLQQGGMRRVQEAYNWSSHARRILHLCNVYSYWNYLDVMNRRALDQYIHTLYHTVYRPRAQNMLQEA